MVKPIFDNIQEIIIRQIEDSRIEIQIAVAWFNNRKIFDTLVKKAKDGVNIKLLIINDQLNNKKGGLIFQELIDAGADFYFAKTNTLMHHKFALFDDENVISGSYNWTYSAEFKNAENVIVSTDDRSFAKAFKTEFENKCSVSDLVSNVKEYLELNPPINHSLELEELLDSELEIEMDYVLESLEPEEQLEFIDNLPEHLATRTDTKERKYKIYETASKNLYDFFTRHPKVLFTQIAENYNFSDYTLDLYKDKLYWDNFANNREVIWDIRLIEKYKNYLDTTGDTRLPRLATVKVSVNHLEQNLFGLKTAYEQYKSRYKEIDYSKIDPDEETLLFIPIDEKPELKSDSPILINDDTDFKSLNAKVTVNWTEETLFNYIDRLYPYSSELWDDMPWSSRILLKIKEARDWQYYMFCELVKLSLSQLEEFKDELDWKGIVQNNFLDWDLNLFSKYREYITPHLNEFSNNKKFPWTAEFIKEHEDSLSFENLSSNPSLPWSESFFDYYGNRWHYRTRAIFGLVCDNDAITWTPYLMDKYKRYIDWDRLARNENVPWTLELMEKYSLYTDADSFYGTISHNEQLWDKLFKRHIDEAFLIRIFPYLVDY